jgi:ferrous iron transport protein B
MTAAHPSGGPEAALAEQLIIKADTLDAKHAKRESFIGRIGQAAAPVFAPMGADWQMTIGIMASFAAREVFVSTMSIVVAGSDDGEDETVRQSLETATRDDGSRLFSPAAAWAMLVFYVLAMQCLPTLVLTAREAGHWKWALLQLAWMSGVAFATATLVYQGLGALGAGGAGG